MNSSINSASQKIEFPPPKGFVPPESDGPEWEMVCSFTTDPDTGKICLKKLGDTPMPDYDEGQKPESKPGYEGMAQSMMSNKIAAPGEGSA